uniref:Uncharacterized protein n=1 Tax=Rhizophora mucronata TaxID=61149 RepID=A0A2P2IWD6_RHIMU
MLLDKQLIPKKEKQKPKLNLIYFPPDRTMVRNSQLQMHQSQEIKT